jgi:hypothetical protein
MRILGWVAATARSIAAAHGSRRAGALRGLAVGGLAAAGSFAVIAGTGGTLFFDQPWNDFEIPIQLTMFLGAPAGLVGGWLLAPLVARPRGVRRRIWTVVALGVVAALIGVVLFALAEVPFAVIEYGPAGLLVVPFLLFVGVFLAAFELPITLPAAVVWVAWMQLAAPAEPTKAEGD